MRKTFTLLLFCFFSCAVFAQTFEGKIVYSNQFKSKIEGVSDEQLTNMMGTTQTYYIKEGNYKSEINGTKLLWMLYVNKDNKLYLKLTNSEALLYNDAGVNKEAVVKAEINKGVTQILGYTCDELILTCKNSVEKYYFNSSLPVDANLFVKHKYGNWYDFVSRSNALPLKMVIQSAEYSLESTATAVIPQKMEPSFFVLPAGAKTMKSPE